jgi:hypothetical protein
MCSRLEFTANPGVGTHGATRQVYGEPGFRLDRVTPADALVTSLASGSFASRHPDTSCRRHRVLPQSTPGNGMDPMWDRPARTTEAAHRRAAVTVQLEAFALSFLIRVQLPDSPGSLGAVATALGGIGADILSVDVVERGGGVAVDDLVVELPSGRLPDVLITAAESVSGVEVDAVRPYAGVLDTHRELELVEDVAEDPRKGLEVFTQGVPKIIRAGWALTLSSTPKGVRRLAASTAAPEADDIDMPWLPLTKATVLDAEDDWVPETWRELGTELAATPLGKPDRALLVARPGGPMFRAAEVARLAHLAGIVAVVLDG